MMPNYAAELRRQARLYDRAARGAALFMLLLGVMGVWMLLIGANFDAAVSFVMMGVAGVMSHWLATEATEARVRADVWDD